MRYYIQTRSMMYGNGKISKPPKLRARNSLLANLCRSNSGVYISWMSNVSRAFIYSPFFHYSTATPRPFFTWPKRIFCEFPRKSSSFFSPHCRVVAYIIFNFSPWVFFDVRAFSVRRGGDPIFQEKIEVKAHYGVGKFRRKEEICRKTATRIETREGRAYPWNVALFFFTAS